MLALYFTSVINSLCLKISLLECMLVTVYGGNPLTDRTGSNHFSKCLLVRVTSASVILALIVTSKQPCYLSANEFFLYYLILNPI